MSFLIVNHRFNIFFGKHRGILVDTLKEFHIWLETDVCDLLKRNIDKRVDFENLTQVEQKCMNYFLREKVLMLSEKLPKQDDISANSALRNSNNAIIILDKLHDFEKTLGQLNEVLIFDLEIRIPKLVTPKDLKKIKELLFKYEFNTVDLIMKYDNAEDIKAIFSRSTFYLNFYIATHTRFEDYRHSKLSIRSIPFAFDMIKSCGKVNKSFFNCSQLFINDARNHNSCLKGKITIDIDGTIKNCPSMPQSFGNIKDTKLQETIKSKDFKKYWNTSKDQIAVCKDCEFRYICTDCRAYREDPNDVYSKPLKCGYSPYTNKWKEWSANPLKQKAIAHFGMQDLVQNREV